MKALILSVRPEHAINILNGKKKIEIRKSVPKEVR
jgi:predicted transcriptional regulator